MSQVDQKENSNPAKVMTSSAKTAAASPKLSADDHVEMSDLPGPSVDEDIMQLARLGDIQGIQKLFEGGKYDAQYCDGEGITPLHWAAINNQYAMCAFLIEQGADVNKKGGESVATPAMWAAQRCHYYVVYLLLHHGADPLITDVQGYNILHLATFEGNVFLLILLLHQSIPVDTTDSHGHTPLMWAAYKGYPACVDLFLRWGADVHATDETGFTPLHWALVKGSLGCIQKLIEYGADRFAETSNGKTPAVTAEEMQTVRVWQKALKECGYAEDGMPVTINIPLASSLVQDKRGFMTKFFFLWPFVIIWVTTMIISHMVIYAAVPLALFWGYALQWFAQQVGEYAPSDMRQLHKTPWLAGIFAGTLFWVELQYLTHILPVTFSSYLFSNIAFIVLSSLCAFFYYSSMAYEPGYVPKVGGLSEQKAAIYELLSLWKFDEQNFCVPCMVRMPLRSKHCKQCQRCVAKHDHHCPWVYNCVGVNNHRHFFLYLVTLALGLGALVRVTIGYFTIISPEASGECNILGESLCRVVNADAYTFVLVSWGTIQLSWVTMLLFVQLVQVSRAMTTYENMMGAHHGHGSKAADAITSALTTGTTSMAGAQLGPAGLGPDPALPQAHAQHGHGHHRHQGCFAQWKKILGVDTFVETALQGSSGTRSRSRRNRNPFSAGCLQNCKDFWCDPSPVFGRRENGEAMLGGAVVNYTMMYESPRIMNMMASANDTAGMYHSVAADDSV